MPLVVILSLLLVAMIGYSATRPAPAQADYTINAVYLTLNPHPALDTAKLRATGIRPVSSLAELVTVAVSAQAIIVDRDALSGLDAAWLAAQYRQGKLIVGIDVPILDLAQRAGYSDTRSEVAQYLQDYGGRPFYSLFYTMTERSGVSRSGTGSDIIYSTEDFIARLRLEAQNSQAQLNPPQAPRPALPRR